LISSVLLVHVFWGELYRAIKGGADIQILKNYVSTHAVVRFNC
jgi:hypothetical protein